MENSKPQHLTKRQTTAIVILSVLFGTIPLFVYQTQKPIPNSQVKAATMVLKQYPGLEWSKPNQEKVSVLLQEGTSDESLVLALGQKSSAVVTTNISQELATYYDKQVKEQGFVQVKNYGDPAKSRYWVKCYSKDKQYVEIQYYPTPYTTNSFTVVLFFGILQEDN